MKFKNIKTGNVLVVKNPDAIALMKGSSNYKEVKEKKGDTGDNGSNANNQPTPENNASGTPPAE